MPIIIRVGRLPEILWALLVLAGLVLVTSGFFNTLNGASTLGEPAYTNSLSISQLTSGVVMFCLGVVAIAAGYLGIRGEIIITRN
jgi:ABC-type sulfate transport system permease component